MISPVLAPHRQRVGHRGAVLVGRGDETARLRALVDEVAAGRTSSLLVVADPGMGKSALLAEAAALATGAGVHVVTVTAVESEAALPGAALEVALARLGSPDLDPTRPQSLLAALVAASETEPVLLVVDDVHWLDGESGRALTFALRRLLADPVGVLMAARPEIDTRPELADVPRLRLGPLAEADAAALLMAANRGIDVVRAHLVARSLGAVPLALVEAAALLTEDELQGRVAVSPVVTVGQAVADRYAAGYRDLPEAARLAATVLAADEGAAALLPEALTEVGVDVADLGPAEDARLVVLGPAPGFVHPLARSAVYSAAAPAVRRRAHRAWAAAAGRAGDLPRSLRHRAAAATAPDEALADDLEREAQRLAAAGLVTEASALAESALALSVSSEARRRRGVLVAETSPDPWRASQVAGQVAAEDAPPELLARCAMVLSYVDEYVPGPDVDAIMERIDRRSLPAPAVDQLDTIRMWSAVDVADLERIDRLTDELEPLLGDRWVVVAAVGSARTFVGDHARGVALLRRAQELSRDVDVDALAPDLLRLWAIVPGWLNEDADEHGRRFEELFRRARATGHPRPMSNAAFFVGERAKRDGRWQQAVASYSESVELVAAMGSTTYLERVRLGCLQAHMGDLDAARAALVVGRSAIETQRVRYYTELWVPYLEGLVAFHEGRRAQAVEAFRRAAHVPYVGRGSRDAMSLSSFELVGLLVTLGEVAAARDEVDRISRMLDGIVDPFGLAMVERCRALVDTDAALDHFDAAEAHHARTDEPFERAGTWLLRGEHLRRRGRSKDARDPLRSAYDVFRQLGAVPWAQRAANELRASGAAVEAVAVASPADLTPQEMRVALAVCEGMTNAEAAAELFLSVKTVEFHLSRVYRKLAVRSRTALRRELGSRGLV